MSQAQPCAPAGGRSAGVTFVRAKVTKTRQREIPLETPCFYVLYRGGAQVGPGPGGAGWMAGRTSGQFLLRWQFPLLPPGPQVWGERPRPAAVGRDAPQVGPKQENGAPPQQRPRRGALLSLLVWQSPFGPIWEATPDSPEQRGGFHKAGEGPAFGDSFVSFSSLRKRPQRSVSASLTELCQRIVSGAAPFVSPDGLPPLPEGEARRS